jgi:phytoene dehydrogenase-like protein
VANYDAVVVGSGPNGLSAAIELARAGKSVIVLEARGAIGGGMRSGELTRPGFVHDVCSAIHPLAASSPAFRDMPLNRHGLEWIHPDLPLAHPFDDGSAAILDRSLEVTAEMLGRDGPAYRKLIGPLLRDPEGFLSVFLGPLSAGRISSVPPARTIPALLHFNRLGLRSSAGLASAYFREDATKALFAGMAAHVILPPDSPVTGGFGLIIALLGHAAGWPLARGGSQRIADALTSYLETLGGEVLIDHEVRSMRDVPSARAVLFDLTPRQLLAIAGDRLPARFRRTLRRFRYGPGVFKVDWALDGPVPWKADACGRAGTVHLCGTLDEIRASESGNARGRHAERPYVLIAQQSLFDPTRAPEGKQTLWGYCHVPHGSTVDMTDRIEAQVERFAPGFRDRVIARATMNTEDVEAHNANIVGGDINGGLQDIRTLFVRPSARWSPYTTPAKDIYICSSSAPPGGGVHGMCGYHAARAALRRAFR